MTSGLNTCSELSLRHAARDDLYARPLAVELDLHVRGGDLIVVGQKLLVQYELGIAGELGVRVAHRRGDAAQLGELHLADRAVFHEHVRNGIQDAIARALSFSIVLLNVLDVRILAAVEAVDAVVL